MDRIFSPLLSLSIKQAKTSLIVMSITTEYYEYLHDELVITIY